MVSAVDPSGQNTGRLDKSMPKADQGPMGSSQSTNNAAPLFFNGKEVSERVFLRRRYVFAMVNDRPVVDGHVLICPVRQVRTMRDLTELEYLELFTCAREVAAKFQ